MVGSASRDVTPDDVRGWRLGGGVSYGALTLARLGIRTGAIIGVDEPAASAPELELLRDAGIDVRLARIPTGPVFEQVETPTGRVQTCHEPGAPIDLAVVPLAWRAAGAWLLAPVAGELAEPMADLPQATSTVALGWQGLLRNLTAGERVEQRAPRRTSLTARADLIGVSGEDLAPGTELADLAGCLRVDATILVTSAARGGFRATVAGDRLVGLRRYGAEPARAAVDTTGAGDVFLAAYLGGILGGSDRELRYGTRRALRLAAVAASLVVEGPGLTRVPTVGQIAQRIGGR